MSTFGALQSAYTGLQAARAGMDVTGQNIANANTEGYTRQRVSQSAIGGVAASSVFVTGVGIGQGARVDGIARLGDPVLDARVRTTASTMGYWQVASAAMTAVEASLNEPGTDGLSQSLGDFWSAWQDVANNPGKPGPAASLITEANQLVSRISAGYEGAAAGWTEQRASASAVIDDINSSAAQVARLNGEIRRTIAAGGSANELIDQRTSLTGGLAGLTGATVRENGDGTVDVLIGGGSLVSGPLARKVKLDGATRVEDADTRAVGVVWDEAPAGRPVEVAGGQLAGHLTALAAAGDGNGGPWAEAAAQYDVLAQKLADSVQEFYGTGTAPDGSSAPFFDFGGGGRTALGLTVVPTGVSGIVIGTGGSDASIAEKIAGLATSDEGVDAAWAGYVVRVGALTRSTLQQATLSTQAATAAADAQTAQSAVDIDEETTNLLTYQYAYQGAARVMTAIDEMLNVLINKTGIVGR